MRRVEENVETHGASIKIQIFKHMQSDRNENPTAQMNQKSSSSRREAVAKPVVGLQVKLLMTPSTFKRSQQKG